MTKLCRGTQLVDSAEKKNLESVDKSEERVLLLTLISKDLSRSERNLAELEGLVRSAGGRPVAIASQKAGALNLQTIWGKGKLQEVALKVREEKRRLITYLKNLIE